MEGRQDKGTRDILSWKGQGGPGGTFGKGSSLGGSLPSGLMETHKYILLLAGRLEGWDITL